jgi:septal ring factor EnvC (AmiA/AmiB activator)
MIFFWLALVALVFGMLGFFANALYFGKKDRVQNLEKEIESMTRVLARRDHAKTEAEQQEAAAKSRAKSLELQLVQGNEEVGALQARIRQQEIQILQLQDALSECRIALDQTVEPKNAEPETGQSEAGAVAGGNEKTPLWKDNLNNILEMLDKIKKDGEQ